MKRLISNSFRFLSAALGLLICLLANHARAAVTYWDPEGTYANPGPYATYDGLNGQTSSQTPAIPGTLAGTWETASWSTVATGAAPPVAWVEGTAVCFATGAGATNSGVSSSTTTFAVTMNANHTVAGMFNGDLNPDSAIVTISGSGTMTMKSGNLNGFALLDSSDGSLAYITINVPIAGDATAGICAEQNGQLYLNGVNTYSGGTYLGYSGLSFASGIWYFNNSASFGTGPIYFLNCVGGALVAEGSSAITIPNSVINYNYYPTTASPEAATCNIVGNPAGVTFSGPWALSGGSGGTGAPNYTTTTPLVGYGSLSLGSGGAVNNVVTISGVISGTSAFSKYGVGVLALTAPNTMSGPVSVTAGTLQIGDPAALGCLGALTTNGTVTVASGATLDLNGQTPINAALNLNGTGNNSGNGALVNSNATTTVVLNGPNGVLSASVTAAGSGITAPATATVSGGGSATATPSLGVTAASFTVTPNTQKYTAVPSVVISGGGGSGAAATVALSGTSPAVLSSTITIVNPGMGYTSTPTVSFSGGTTSGTGLTAPAIAANGTHFKLMGIQITAPGSGYTSAPTITLSTGSGVAAAGLLASVNLASASSIGGPGNITINDIVSGTGALTKVGTGTVTLTAPNTFSGATTVSAGTLLVNGSLASASAVTVASGGILSGSGTINGTVTVASGGILNGSGTINGAVTVASGATFGGGFTGTINGAVTVSDGGTLAPGGVNNISTLTLTTSGNALTLNGGLLLFDLNDSTIPGSTYDTIAIGGTGALVLNGANYIQLESPSGTIAAGSYTLMTYASMSGSGTLTLPNGAMTMGNFTLAVNPTSVTLTVSAGSSGALTWTGSASGLWNITDVNWADGSTATTYSDGSSVTFDDTALGNFTISGGTVLPGSVLFNNDAKAYTVSATIAGSTPLVKSGSGLATLSGPNTYTGASILNGGILNLGAAETPGTSGPLGAQAANAAGSIILGGGTLQYSAANLANDYSGRFSTAASQAYNIDVNGQTVTFATPLTSVGGILTLSSTAGGGKLTLTGANTYTGGTTLNGGTLSVGTIADSGTSAIGNVGTLTLAGGTLSYTGAAAASTGRTVTGTGTIDVPSTAGILTLSNVTGGATFTITKTSTGTLTLGGTVDNSFLAMNINAGTVVLAKNPSSSGAHALGVNSTVNIGGTLQLGGTGGDQIYSGVTVTVATGGVFDANGQNEGLTSLALKGTGISSGGALINNAPSTTSTLTCTFPLGANSSIGGSGNLTLAGVVSGAFSLTYVGTGTLTLNSVETYSAGTTINSGGTLTIGGAGTLLAAGVIANNGTFIYNSTASETLSGVISGTGTLTQQGTGTLTLSGANTYSGITTIQNGSLVISSDANLGTAPSSFVANQLTLNNNINNGANNYGLRDTGGNFTLSAKRGIYLGANGGSINVQGAFTLTVAGVISGPGTFWSSPSSSAGYGTNVLSGANTYTGGTIIAAGALTLGASGALPYGTSLTIGSSSQGAANGSFFNMNGKSQTIGPLASSTGFGATGTGTPTVQLTGALTVLQTNVSTTFAGTITGSGGSLTINGNSSGKLILTKANTYTGLTTINGGTLDGNFAGSIAGSVTVNTGTGGILQLDSTTAMSSSANLTLDSSPAANSVNLTFSGTQTINALYFGSTPQATGLYGAIGNVSATYQIAAITGPGLLNVTCTAPAQTITPAVSPVCAGSMGNTASVTTTAGATYAWSIAGGTITAGGTSSTVTYTAGVGSAVTLNCVVTASCGVASAGAQNVSVTINPLPTVSVNSQTVCANALPATVTATPLVGTGPFNYVWTVPSGPNPGNVASFTTSIAGSYTVVVTDAHGCVSASGSGTLTINAAPTVNAGANQTICSGCSASLNATASGGSGSGYTYLWSPSTGLSPNATVANPAASPAATTTYAVTVTDGNGCVSAPSSVTVTVANVAPAISGQPGNTTVCSGTPATFTVGATGSSLNYSWTKVNNSGWSSPWSVTGSGGTFLDTSTNNDQGLPGTPCTTFASNLGDIDSPLHAQALGLWSGGSPGTFATRTFPALTAGQVVSIDFDNGNVDSSGMVGFSLQPLGGGSDVLKFYFQGGGSNYMFTINGGTPQDTGIGWTGTGLRVQFALTCANTYVMTVTPCSGSPATFTGTYTGTIAQLQVFNSNIYGGNANNVFFNNLIVGGYTDNADNYYGVGFSNGSDQGNQPIALANGSSYTTTPLTANAQYQAVVAGCGGAMLSSVASVTVNPLPTVSVNSQTVCASALPATITATPLGGTGPFNYVWTVPSGPNPGNVASFTTSIAGSYTVVVTDANGCVSASGSGTLTVNPNPTVTVNSQTVCANTLPATITATPVGTGPFNYVWTVPSGPNPGNAASFTTSIAGSYAVVVTDANGCASASGSGTLTVNASPTVGVNSAAICTGGSATISASPAGGTPGYSYAWTVPVGATAPGNVASFSATVAGTYSVVVTDANGCTGGGSGVLTVNTAPIAEAGPDQTICPGGSGVAIGGSPTATGGTGPYTYSWAPITGLSDATAANPTAIITGTTTYTVTVTDAHGCTASDSVVVTVIPQPEITSITMSGTDMTLVWSSLSGQTYRVQYTTDLTPTITWTDLTPDVPATGATATYTDHAGAATQRFYRIKIVCP